MILYYLYRVSRNRCYNYVLFQQKYSCLSFRCCVVYQSRSGHDLPDQLEGTMKSMKNTALGMVIVGSISIMALLVIEVLAGSDSNASITDVMRTIADRWPALVWVMGLFQGLLVAHFWWK